MQSLVEFIQRCVLTVTMLEFHMGGVCVVPAPLPLVTGCDGGLAADAYFALNGAVPSEAYMTSPPLDWNNPSNSLVHSAWRDYLPKTWASHWHELFPTNDTRNQLTWKNRFADVPQQTEIHNCYSTGDEVLAVFDTPDPDGSGKITIKPFGVGGSRIHSWQKQERFKGRWGQNFFGGWAGTSEMGWGFSSQGYYSNGTPPLYQTIVDPTDPQHVVVVRAAPYGTNAAANASTAQLRVDPVFNHDPPKMFSGNLQRRDVDELLARGVPALSGPVGSMAMLLGSSVLNEDLNGFSLVTGWPRAGKRLSQVGDTAMSRTSRCRLFSLLFNNLSNHLESFHESFQ